MNKRLDQLVKVSDLLFEARQILRRYDEEAAGRTEKDWALDQRQAIDDVRREVVNHWSANRHRLQADTTSQPNPPVPLDDMVNNVVPWVTWVAWKRQVWERISLITCGQVDEVGIPESILARWFGKGVCVYCAAQLALEWPF